MLPPSPQRSRNMAAVKAKNTAPERRIRRLLYAAGYRYRLHDARLPGKPDMVLRAYHCVIFIHGCFWHHHTCPHGQHMPKRNAAYWEAKLRANAARDIRTNAALTEHGFRVLCIWECAVNGKRKLTPARIMDDIAAFLDDKSCIRADISGIDIAEQ